MEPLKKYGFYSAFTIPALVILGYLMGGWWNYLVFLDVFILLPLLDQWVGIDNSNIPEDRVSTVAVDSFYRFITYTWTYFQFGFVLWACYVVVYGTLDQTYEWIGFVLGVSLVTGGIGITVAHELGHKKSALERFYSKVILMTVGYMHFYIEHNRGHHVKVATPEDPATALKNESFYAFWIKSVFKGWFHAWHLEKVRLQKMGKSWFSVHNQMVWYSTIPALFVAVLTVIFSVLQSRIVWEIPAFMTIQSLLAFSLLELVNYVEHYGILRKEVSPGKYEKVTPIHSWNSSHIVSNFFLFQLQRHSDHHANAIKRYQVLDHYDKSPQLPVGYPTMILIALIPPLWFHVMNPRLEKWHGSHSPYLA
ncbi:MAG: alkane 1-monooxygenase [Cyclobacteriaceae bacterium]